MFCHSEYLLDGPGSSIAVSGLHEEFFNSDFGVWIGGKNSGGCYRPIMIQKLWRALGLNQNRVEQLSSLRHEEAMRQKIVVTGKPGMSALMLALKEA